jgi:hypothetical protein
MAARRPKINPFHTEGEESAEKPMRFYGLVVETGAVEAGKFVIVDMIGMDWFDQNGAQGADGLSDMRWCNLLGRAPVAALEINSGRMAAGKALLKEWPLAERSWYSFVLQQDANGGALLYRNMFGGAVPVRIVEASVLSTHQKSKLRKSVSLPSGASTSSLRSLLRLGTIDHIGVYDVGQGLAQGLLNRNGVLIAYVDFGGGVLSDAGTWPTAMTGFCLSRSQPIILSHWHYDHFSSANRYPAARRMNWIAPNQTLGPGPQATFAAHLLSLGTLRIYPSRHPRLTVGRITVESCTGTNQNESGIAVIVDGPASYDPVVLPGDAGYACVPTLTTVTPHSIVVPHHGGRARGPASLDPGHATSRVIISCGPHNSYGHPLPVSLAKLSKSGIALRHRTPTCPEVGRISSEYRSSERAPTDPRDQPSRVPCSGCRCSLSLAQW